MPRHSHEGTNQGLHARLDSVPARREARNDGDRDDELLNQPLSSLRHSREGKSPVAFRKRRPLVAERERP